MLKLTLLLNARPGSGSSGGTWLFSTGYWNGQGIWIDTDLWPDAAAFCILQDGDWNDQGVWCDSDAWND